MPTPKWYVTEDLNTAINDADSDELLDLVYALRDATGSPFAEALADYLEEVAQIKEDSE